MTCREGFFEISRSLTVVGDRENNRPERQVQDLPPIGVAEPLLK